MYHTKELFLLLIITFNYVNSVPTKINNYEFNIIHINDFHARYEETNIASGKCKNVNECIGGLGRIKTEIDDLLIKKPNSIVLNAGDNFQGTLYYHIFKYNITSFFLNTIPFDAVILGNHEFDDGIEGVVPYMKLLKAPILLSNVNDTLEPTFQNLYQKSIVIERNGKKIGIIGVLIKSCADISNTGKLTFFDESESVNKEAERLVKEEGVFTNIVLSHSGYDVEKFIAENAKNKIRLVVGGHSHTFLYTGDNPQGPDKDKIEGPYPTVITNQDGDTVLVVQASAYTKYLGNIDVIFDENGDIESWNGEPIFMEDSIEQDPSYLKELAPYTEVVEERGNDVLGSSLVLLQQNDCKIRECLLGNFVADAMVYSYTNEEIEKNWTKASIALVNAGAIRETILKGNITYDDMSTAQPFGNDIYIGEVTGKELLDIFEFSATQYFIGRPVNLLQTSGVKVIMDTRKPIGSRIISLKLLCADCDMPIYEDCQPDKIYKIIVPEFLLNGGDGFNILTKLIKNVEEGELDMDVYTNYLKHRSPIFEEINDRTIILGV